jgi:hypothetical protein
MVVSRHKNHNLLTANKFFENVAKFTYLGITVSYEICIHEEIKGTLNSVNACYHFVQNLLSSRLPSRNFFYKRHLQSFADLWPTLMGFSIYI